MSKTKATPKCKPEAEKSAFLETHDSSDYLDWEKAQTVMMPNLKPSTKTIPLRLPEDRLDSIKIEANKRDIPYQPLIKSWLADDVKHSHDA